MDASASMADLFKGFTASGSDNVMLVRDYLLARELMGTMDTQLGLRRLFAKGDAAARFPAPWQPDSLEEFAGYYQEQVKVDIDPNSAVGVLTVRAFAAQDALQINRALLASAQARIEQLNARIRQDSQQVAERELARAQERLAKADAMLAGFRVERHLLDPERQGALALQAEQELNGRLVAAQGRLEQVKRLAPDSPQRQAIESEVRNLQSAVTAQRASVSSAASGSHAVNAQDYQGLQLERELASRNLAAAHEALIRARVDVERKHLYLETVSAPSLPDSALQPHRLRAVAAVLFLSLAVFAVASLMRLGVREHGQAL